MNGVQGWIGVDLDSTLAYYDEWRGVDHIGLPVPLMVERVRRWIAQGREVRIFTARVSTDVFEDRARVIHAIKAWCITHIGYELPVTNVKDFAMVECWDDRAVTVEANTGRQLAPSSRGLA